MVSAYVTCVSQKNENSIFYEKLSNSNATFYNTERKERGNQEEKTHLPLKSVDFHTVDNNLNWLQIHEKYLLKAQ